MALFKPMVGADRTALDAKSKVAGYVWFTTDDGKFYIDWDNNGTLMRSVLNAGHADSATNDSNGNKITSTYVTFNNLSDTIQNYLDNTPPKMHVSTDTTYGVCDQSHYGHVKIGSNISVTNGVISLSKANVTTALGYTPPTKNTTYTFATGYNNGEIRVTSSEGTEQAISVHGLGSAAYKDASGSWDISITGSASSANTATTASFLDRILAVEKGGTGASTSPKAGGIMYANTPYSYASTAAGTAGQYLKSNGKEAPTWATVTSDDIGAATKNHGIYYGTCESTASTTEKIVTLTDATGFSLTEGIVVIVKFTNSNSAASPTMNVNSTGALPLYRYGSTSISTSSTTSGWSAGSVHIFVYDGTSWTQDYWYNTTYSNFKGATSSSSGSSGLVPAPKASSYTRYLNSKGEWSSISIPSNTAGATNSSSKLYIIGRPTQDSGPSYSHDTAYIGEDGCLYSNSTKVSVEGHTHSYVPTTRTVNGKALSGNISLTYSDVGAAAASHGTHVTSATVKSALGTGTGTSKYLREDGTWVTPPNTNTHYTTRLYVGASGTVANAAATNPYLKVTDDNTYRNQIQFKGSGATTVSSDANGVITISSTDTNTNTDTKVTQGRSTASNYRPLLMHYSNGNYGTDVGSATNSVYYNETIAAKASTGELRATSFVGSGASLTSLNASNISSGTIAAARLPNATSSAKGGVIVGSNITVSSGTISLTKANVVAALGYTPPSSAISMGTSAPSGGSNGDVYFKYS